MARSPLARSRRHLAWPLLLVAAGLAATAAVAWRAQSVARESRATAERLVLEHAGFAAWSFRRDAEEALGEAVWMVVNPILHRHPHELERFPQAGHLPLYLAQSIDECGCEVPWRPQSYFAFVLGSDTLGTAGERGADEIRRWVGDTLTAHLRDPGELRGRSGLIAGRPGAASLLLGYGLMPMTRGDTIVYAFTIEPRSIAPLFERAFAEASLLPATVTRGRVNDSILAVRVVGPAGVPFYQSTGWDSTYAADDVLRPAAAGLSIQTALRPLLVNDILAGELPPERLPLAVAGLLLLAAATLVVGVRQLRREEELGRARADFVASVSHELRTPLAQIRLFLETLRLGRFRTDEQREWLLGHLDRETLRLSTLVENVLAFARRDAGRERSGAGEPADLMREVSDAVRAFAPLAAARHVTIVVEPAEQLGARLDRTAFRQLLLNLFDNAVKYGPPGGTIRIVAAPADSMVRLTVSDDGPGVAPEERERVWKPFVRGGGQAVQAIGGSGLGLALVRDIAEGMGGSARFAEPDPEGLRTGARVVIELPAAPLPAAHEPAAPTPERVAV
jgi:signal transduction histidine kinase